MGVVSVSVTKSTDFQGKTDEYSNVYNYSGDFNGAGAIQALADAVVAMERPIFNNSVSFKKVRVWGEDSLGRNTMLLTQDLTGTGTNVSGGVMYRECAIMVRWPLAPRISATASLSNPFKRVSRYLRKYLHTGFPHNYDQSGAGNASFPVAGSSLETYAIKATEPLAGVKLCNADGDTPSGPHKFAGWLEHRQFPRGRKE